MPDLLVAVSSDDFFPMSDTVAHCFLLSAISCVYSLYHCLFKQSYQMDNICIVFFSLMTMSFVHISQPAVIPRCCFHTAVDCVYFSDGLFIKQQVLTFHI